jgi:required for meiotic nuclear division protein 1
MGVMLEVKSESGIDDLLYPDEEIEVLALHVGDRIDVRELNRAECILPAPALNRVGDCGYAVVFRYGVVVLFHVSDHEVAQFQATIGPFVSGALEIPEREEALILITPDGEEKLRRQSASHLLEQSGIVLRSATRGRLQIVAEVLGKSVALTHYHRRVSSVFDRIEPFAVQMRTGYPLDGTGRDLLQLLGDATVTQTHMIGRVEIRDKPDLAWGRADLDRLYQQLAAEYELRERDAALTKKLDLVSSTTSTFFNLQESRRALRVEWYIVVLILVEIGLILYEIFMAA